MPNKKSTKIHKLHTKDTENKAKKGHKKQKPLHEDSNQDIKSIRVMEPPFMCIVTHNKRLQRKVNLVEVGRRRMIIFVSLSSSFPVERVLYFYLFFNRPTKQIY